MSTIVFLSVLMAAALHASWNALIKRDSEPAAMSLAMLVMGAVVALPLLVATGLPDAAAWPYLAISMLIHSVYTLVTALSYRHGDLSVAYPVARGCAPVLATLGAVLLADEVPGTGGWIGVGLVFGGALLVAVSVAGLSRSKGAGHNQLAAIGFALISALMIASYTVVDGLGVRAAGSALPYILAGSALSGLSTAVLLRLVHGKSVLTAAARRWKMGLAGGLIAMVSYGIALNAMTLAPIGEVAALRETSIAFAVAIGVLFLGERAGLARIAGAGLILAGAIAIRS
jgi:drug/metabolite transporter (DMT)-like permease